MSQSDIEKQILQARSARAAREQDGSARQNNGQDRVFKPSRPASKKPNEPIISRFMDDEETKQARPKKKKQAKPVKSRPVKQPKAAKPKREKPVKRAKSTSAEEKLRQAASVRSQKQEPRMPQSADKKSNNGFKALLGSVAVLGTAATGLANHFNVNLVPSFERANPVMASLEPADERVTYVPTEEDLYAPEELLDMYKQRVVDAQDAAIQQIVEGRIRPPYIQEDAWVTFTGLREYVMSRPHEERDLRFAAGALLAAHDYYPDDPNVAFISYIQKAANESSLFRTNSMYARVGGSAQGPTQFINDTYNSIRAQGNFLAPYQIRFDIMEEQNSRFDYRHDPLGSPILQYEFNRIEVDTNVDVAYNRASGNIRSSYFKPSDITTHRYMVHMMGGGAYSGFNRVLRSNPSAAAAPAMYGRGMQLLLSAGGNVRFFVQSSPPSLNISAEASRILRAPEDSRPALYNDFVARHGEDWADKITWKSAAQTFRTYESYSRSNFAGVQASITQAREAREEAERIEQNIPGPIRLVDFVYGESLPLRYEMNERGMVASSETTDTMFGNVINPEEIVDYGRMIAEYTEKVEYYQNLVDNGPDVLIATSPVRVDGNLPTSPSVRPSGLDNGPS